LRVADVAWNWRNETCFQLTMKERGVEEAAVLFPAVNDETVEWLRMPQ
jgi:hypothetical protein